MLDVFRSILYENDGRSNLNNIEEKDTLFKKIILSNYESLPVNILSKKFDLLKFIPNGSLTFELYKESDVEYKKSDVDNKSIVINGKRYKSFFMSLLRVRLRVGAFFGLNYRPSNIIILDGGREVLLITINKENKFLVYVNPLMINFFGVRLVKSSLDYEAKSILPCDGAYYSPEFYRILSSLYEELGVQVPYNKTKEFDIDMY